MSIPRVIPCFHSFGQAPTSFALDLSRALRYSGTLIPYVIHEQSCYVEASRNKLVKAFLGSEGTHMLMLDVDISFESDAFLKTFTILEQYGADVLYGNYSLGNSGNSLFGSPENQSGESAVLVNLLPNHVYDSVVTGGTGWLLAKRGILERMQKECPGPWHWFNRDLTTDGADLRGEDISFGLRLFGMEPRPKVLGTTAVLLRHLKTQALIPAMMAEEATKAGVAAVGLANPYENNPNFLINGHTVIDKSTLTPEALKVIEAELKAGKEVQDALRSGAPEVQGGGTPQRLEAGPQGEVEKTGDSNHAE